MEVITDLHAGRLTTADVQERLAVELSLPMRDLAADRFFLDSVGAGFVNWLEWRPTSST